MTERFNAEGEAYEWAGEVLRDVKLDSVSACKLADSIAGLLQSKAVFPVVLSGIQRTIYATAKAKGFYDPPREFGTSIALIHSELSEALEAWRKPPDVGGHTLAEEFADVVIRVLDTCEHLKIDLGTAILDKMRRNRERPYRHGGKRC